MILSTYDKAEDDKRIKKLKEKTKQEANFSLVLRHYLKANPLPLSSHIEVKDTRGKDSFPFSEVKEEQVNNALASNSPKGNLIRVSVGTIGAPDYCYYRDAPAYIVIKYPKVFVFITIGTFLLEKERSKRKSLTVDRALEISVKSVKLK